MSCLIEFLLLSWSIVCVIVPLQANARPSVQSQEVSEAKYNSISNQYSVEKPVAIVTDLQEAKKLLRGYVTFVKPTKNMALEDQGCILSITQKPQKDVKKKISKFSCVGMDSLLFGSYIPQSKTLQTITVVQGDLFFDLRTGLTVEPQNVAGFFSASPSGRWRVAGADYGEGGFRSFLAKRKRNKFEVVYECPDSCYGEGMIWLNSSDYYFKEAIDWETTVGVLPFIRTSRC